MPLRIRTIVTWAAAIAWAAVIFSLSALPGSAVPGRFGSLAHFTEYAILGGLLLIALSPRKDLGASAVLALALASSYAVTDELHQSFVVMRMPDVVDWLVDTAGALTAVALLAGTYRVLAARRS